jgi:uncharacterized protein
MASTTAIDLGQVSQTLGLAAARVQTVVDLLDAGNTVPFITRYRKDQTGGMDEEQIRAVQSRVLKLRLLAERKQTILRSIDSQGKLTAELAAEIAAADTPRRLEDLYLPYKPRKQTLATIARDRGLEPLADEILNANPACADLDARAADFISVDRKVATAADALLGAGHILAEWFSERADLRGKLRAIFERTGKLVSTRLEAEPKEKEATDKKESAPAAETASAAAAGSESAAQADSEPRETQLPLFPDVPLISGAAEEPALADGEQTLAPSGEIAQSEIPSGEVPASDEPSGEGPANRAASSDTSPGHTSSGPSSPEAPASHHAPAGQAAVAETPVVATALPAKKKGKAAKKAAKAARNQKDDDKAFRDYFQYSEAINKAPPHRVLAINRGERAKVLRVRIDADVDAMYKLVDELLIPVDRPHADFLRGCARDALTRLILPSLEREVRRELTDRAEMHAVEVFARNLRNLLLQPPVRDARVLAIDPGFKSGCKIVAIDEFGNVLDHGVAHIVGSEERRAEGKRRAIEMVRRHQLKVIAVGNGTGCRAAEQWVSDLIAGKPIAAEPVAAEPIAGEPIAEQPVAREPVAREPVAREPVAREPVAREPVAREPVAREPVAAEPVAGEPVAGEPVAGGPVAGEPVAGEPVAGEPVAGEPVAGQPIAGEPVAREPIGGELADANVAYVVVNEAGASVYSTSRIGREELPKYDATARGAVSIGRRLQDPLSELVKIDPANIGVGMYQHDIKAKHLRDSLDSVVASCVNFVGVDLNTASPALLRYVSGLNQLTARRVYDYRIANGPFKTREELKSIQGFGEATFVQAAGFLKIADGANPLDATWIHPESYGVAEQILAKLDAKVGDLQDKERSTKLAERLAQVPLEELASHLNVGTLGLRDIVSQLTRPGRDPRESLPQPIFKRGILKIDDLTPGMELSGTVLNVVDFGAFIDIGLKDSGLVHISQLANRYVQDPHEVVAVGDIVHVWVLEVDKERRRVSLTMIKPGTRRQNEPRRNDAPRKPARPPASAGAQTTGPSRKPPVHQRPHGRPPRHPPKKVPDKPPPKPKAKPAPQVPLSQAMIEGKAPLRTFGDLKQFWNLKQQEAAEEEKSTE